jgi:hypothetical protein
MKAMIGMDYQQINADHTIFFRQHGDYIIMLAVYVDDMIIKQFRYFFKIEMACGAEGIVLSQRKYVLDLLSETCMLGCKPAVSPIYVEVKMSADAGEQLNYESF